MLVLVPGQIWVWVWISVSGEEGAKMCVLAITLGTLGGVMAGRRQGTAVGRVACHAKWSWCLVPVPVLVLRVMNPTSQDA